MLYTPLTKRAMRICWDAHKDQIDKSGLPYVLHPVHLAEQMHSETETCVALLHDVVEDTPLSLDDLAREGFPKDVLDALALLTHDSRVPYMDYVRALRSNAVARKVKIADLEHNSDLSRLEAPTGRDLARREKYQQALELLRN